MPQNDRPQPPLNRANAPTAFALRNILDRKARGRLRAAATVEAFGNEVAWVDADGWRYELEAPPRVTISPKDIERAAATVDLRVWDASNALIFRDRIHAWDGFPVLVPDGSAHEETLADGTTHRVDNFRESPAEAARLDLAHTVRVVTKNGPWVKDKPGTVSTFYGEEGDGNIFSQDGNASAATAYANAVAGTGASFSASTNTLWCGQTGALDSGLEYRTVYESFLGFDLSGLPDADTLTDATLSLYGSTNLSTVDFSVEAREYDYGGTVETADWRTPAQLSGLARLATFATAGITTSGYNDFTSDGTNLLDAIDPTGTLRMVLVSAETVASSDPGRNNEYVAFKDASTAGTTQDPKLVVTHAAASVPFRRSLLGVGF